MFFPVSCRPTARDSLLREGALISTAPYRGATPPLPSRTETLSTSTQKLVRAACLATRFEALGDLAIEACERGIQTSLDSGLDSVDADLAHQWFELGLCRRMRAERTKRAEDYDDAVIAYEAGFALTDKNDPIGNNGLSALLRPDSGLEGGTRDRLMSLGDSVTPVPSDDRSEHGMIVRWNIASQEAAAHIYAEQELETRSTLGGMSAVAKRLDKPVSWEPLGQSTQTRCAGQATGLCWREVNICSK